MLIAIISFWEYNVPFSANWVTETPQIFECCLPLKFNSLSVAVISLEFSLPELLKIVCNFPPPEKNSGAPPSSLFICDSL